MERTIVIDQMTRREAIEDEIIYLQSLKRLNRSLRPDFAEACKVSETIVMLVKELKSYPIYYGAKIGN